METRRDLLLSLLFAIGLHAGLVALLFFGLWWSRPPQTLSVAGPVIEAVLVSDPGGGRTPPRPAPPKPAPPPAPEPVAPPPQPEPTPSPQQAEVPPQPAPRMPVPRPDTREQERAARLAREQEEKARAEAAERRRQEQILLEQQARKAEAERRERLRKQAEETERKLAEIRKQREAAERASRLAAERLRQLKDREPSAGAPNPRPDPGPPAPAPARAGNEGTDESLLGQYMIAIQRAVERNWLRPETVRPGVKCKMRIRQIVGGEVIAVSIDASCPYDDLGRRSIEAAVLKAQPLPYTGFEPVFRPDLLFTFTAPES